jgi:hypothetical protein
MLMVIQVRMQGAPLTWPHRQTNRRRQSGMERNFHPAPIRATSHWHTGGADDNQRAFADRRKQMLARADWL